MCRLGRGQGSQFSKNAWKMNSVCLYRCAKEGKFMQIALVLFQRKIKFNVVDTFIGVLVFFFCLFWLSLPLPLLNNGITLTFLHPVLHAITFCYIRSAIVLFGIEFIQHSSLSTTPISDAILAKDITLDHSKAWFAHWSQHVYFSSWLDNIGEFRDSMAEIGSHYDCVLTFVNYSLSSERGLLVSSTLMWNTAKLGKTRIFDGSNH